MATEAALITPLFVGIIFALVEFAFLLVDLQAINAESRAGARVASALAKQLDDDGDQYAWSDAAAEQVLGEGGPISAGGVQEIWVYRAKDNSNLPRQRSSFDAGCTVCNRYTVSGGVPTRVHSGWAASDHNACWRKNPDRVGVFVKSQHDYLTKLIIPSSTLTTTTVLNFEPVLDVDCTGATIDEIEPDA